MLAADLPAWWTSSRRSSPAAARASQAATFVPADAVRAFLQEHHITPATAAAGTAVIDQSVVRVICVRK